MKRIEMRGKHGVGKVAIVDDEDYELLSSRKWWANADGYAIARAGSGRKSPSILMHRLLLNPPRHLQIDHINGNRLDNRRCNLRLCNTAQNNQNMRPGARKGSSQFKGVHWCNERHKWCATIKGANRRYNLGRFDNEEDAARAYDCKAAELFGEFAKFNLLPK